MALQTQFSQNDLIKTTGTQYPLGVCLGLVAQWLIAMNKTIGGESTFWTDMRGSLANSENTPLMGMGYAKEAIKFQGEYNNNLGQNGSTGPYTRQQLLTAKLSYLDEMHATADGFSNFSLTRIIDKVLTHEGRYFVLGIRGTAGGHAIGIYRSYSLIGKSSSVQIFDPNIGKYACDGAPAIQTDMNAIGNFYNGTLHQSYILEAYKN